MFRQVKLWTDNFSTQLQGKVSFFYESMLFQVGLNSGHVDTKLADKGLSPVCHPLYLSFLQSFTSS